MLSYQERLDKFDEETARDIAATIFYEHIDDLITEKADESVSDEISGRGRYNREWNDNEHCEHEERTGFIFERAWLHLKDLINNNIKSDIWLNRIAKSDLVFEPQTGGGCQAYGAYDLYGYGGKGYYALITTPDGTKAPKQGDSFIIGIYSKEKEGEAEYMYQSVATEPWTLDDPTCIRKCVELKFHTDLRSELNADV